MGNEPTVGRRQEQACLPRNKRRMITLKNWKRPSGRPKREIDISSMIFIPGYADANGVSYQQAQPLSKAEIDDLKDYIKKVYAHIGELTLRW